MCPSNLKSLSLYSSTLMRIHEREPEPTIRITHTENAALQASHWLSLALPVDASQRSSPAYRNQGGRNACPHLIFSSLAIVRVLGSTQPTPKHAARRGIRSYDALLIGTQREKQRTMQHKQTYAQHSTQAIKIMRPYLRSPWCPTRPGCLHCPPHTA
jgi:hypothetical protein